MEQRYLLDIEVQETQFSTRVCSRGGVVWLRFIVDSVSQPVETEKHPPSATVHFNHARRFLLNTPTLDGLYFKTLLFTLTQDRRAEMLAAAQVPLQKFAHDGPAKFTFSLLAGDSRSTDAIVTITGCLSSVSLPQRATYPGSAEPFPPPIKKKMPRAEIQATYGGRMEPRFPYPQSLRGTQQCPLPEKGPRV